MAFSRALSISNPGIPYVLFILGSIGDSLQELIESECGNTSIVLIRDILSDFEIQFYVRRYTAFEVCCALRAVCHDFMMTQSGFASWLMLDTDIVVSGSLKEVRDILYANEILLTAHSSRPVQAQFVIPHEKSLLTLGLYNGGVIGFRKGSESEQAIQWMKSRFRHYSEASRMRMWNRIDTIDDFLFVDQLWLNFLPLYFRSVHVSLDPCLNLGYWNLWQGKLERDRADNAQFFFNGKAVVIFHFSGLPKGDLSFVTKHTQMYEHAASPEWADAASAYLDRLEVCRQKIPSQVYTYDNHQPKPALSLLGKLIKFLRSH